MVPEESDAKDAVRSFHCFLDLFLVVNVALHNFCAQVSQSEGCLGECVSGDGTNRKGPARVLPQAAEALLSYCWPSGIRKSLAEAAKLPSPRGSIARTSAPPCAPVAPNTVMIFKFLVCTEHLQVPRWALRNRCAEPLRTSHNQVFCQFSFRRQELPNKTMPKATPGHRLNPFKKGTESEGRSGVSTRTGTVELGWGSRLHS